VAKRTRKLLVVDGANTLFRAFFAIPGLRSPDGRATNAAYGFINTLAKVMREESPDFVAVAWDARGPTFRHELYADYKAGRDATPEDLKAQIPMVRELVEALRVPILEVEGVEADDVIATLVHEAPDDVAVTIVSTDKDLMQLVSDRVVLVDGMKDRRYEPADVEARFGVPPERMLDLRALVGDPSDNIPGVKGIGEKGAAKLINEFGRLEALLDHAGDVKAKRAREALQEQPDEARLSKALSTLKDDVALEVSLDDLAVAEADRDRLRQLYEELGFSRLLEALDREGEGDAPATGGPPSVEVQIAAALDDWESALDAIPPDEPVVLVAVAGQGSAVDAPWVGIALATGEAGGLYAPLLAPEEGEGAHVLDPVELATSLEHHFERTAGSSWVGSDTQRIQSLAADRGVRLPVPAGDAELAGFLLDSSSQASLPTLASRYLGRDVPSWEQVAGRGAKAVAAEAMSVDDIAGWAVAQACTVRGLVPVLDARIETDGLDTLYRQVELPLTAVLSRMERNGVRLDERVIESLAEEYDAELARLEKEIYAVAGEEFKVNSPKQLQAILFEKLKLTPIKKTKTGFSTDEGVLEQLASEHELPGRILAWRRLSKLVSTYLTALPPLVSPATGRLHPFFHQTGAATGRLSCSQPNLQNIPIRTPEGVRIREAFVPAEGHWLVSADYSQVELRILAHYSGDESLVDAFQKGEDIHRRTAAEVAGIAVDDVSDDQRARAKAVNFGIIYGSSAFGLANNLGIATSEAQATIDAYFERYQGVRRFLDETIEGARKSGFVSTLLSRRRYLPDLASKNRTLRQAAERMAVNSVIQGSAADLIKQAMVEVDEALADEGLSSRMILQVHDELVFEVPEAEVETLEGLVRARMEGVFALRVPLVVDVGRGRNWREAH
jgi:DNA polymerase-1